MPKLPVIKAKELDRALQRLGFEKFHQVGSHAQFKHSDGRKITVPLHSGKDIRKKILRGIISDLNLTIDEFRKVLTKRR